MRIILSKGKQKELINLARSFLTWEDFAKTLGISCGYLRGDLCCERVSISEDFYQKLCILAKRNFDRFIINKLKDSWGRSKGGILSRGNTKEFVQPLKSLKLAELFGIILGDGHICSIQIGKKIRAYEIVIAGDARGDRDYLEGYVSNLFKDVFGISGKISFSKFGNGMFIKFHGKKLVEFFKKNGLMSGNKKINNQGIPKWILSNNDYLKVCLRGLIDTDGGVYYISKKTNKNIRITYTSYIANLMSDVRNSFVKLGFGPSKIIRGRDIYLTSKKDVENFIKNIGFSNNKHLKRIQNLIKCAPIV